MRKRLLVLLAAGFLLAGLAGVSQAALVTIGTAQFGGSGTEYNLIWDDDNNGNSVVWLDYTNAYTNWSAQGTWAAGIDSSLIYDIDAAYTVDWGGNAWRLPSAGVDPVSGSNQTTSEMGHLFYTELELDFGVTSPAELNAGAFDYLVDNYYWSGTGYAGDSDRAWSFYMGSGLQHNDHPKSWNLYGLAVRSGHVSVVPVPAAFWLFGSGLTGLAALGWRRKGNRV